MSTENQQFTERLHALCDPLFDGSPTLKSFLNDLLPQLVRLDFANAAVVWKLESQTEASQFAQANLESISRDGKFFSMDPEHMGFLVEAVQRRRTRTETDRTCDEAGLKPHSLFISAVPADRPPFLVFELITLITPNQQRIAQLREVAETIVDYIQRFAEKKSTEAARQEAPQDDFWMHFDAFVLQLQKTLDLKNTLAVAVNDGRTLMDADRVSIALKYGNRVKVEAVSGQDGVQQRANLIDAMTNVVRVGTKLGTPVTYQGNVKDIPAELEDPLSEYLKESRTRMVMLIPLYEPEETPGVSEDDGNVQTRRTTRNLIGMLVVEQATESRPKQHVVERSELLKEHIEVAINNCQQHESIFLLPVWRTLGRGLRWFKGRRLWIAIAVVLACVGIGFGLALVPYDYRVEGAGQALPVEQHEIFAPWDGDVKEISIVGGQEVHSGDLLVRLESDDLRSERVTLENELIEKEKLVVSRTNDRAAAIRNDNEQEFHRIEAELAKAIVERDAANQKLQTIKDRIAKLSVKSPADGVVATFQVEQLLKNRPVHRGELLMEVMEPQGEWHLELEVPEYRMGHVMAALEASPTKSIEVEYILATQVEKSYYGELKLSDVATRSSESTDEGTVFEVYVDLPKEELPNPQIGAEVIAKINCGPKSLFYVLFGDVVEFIQRYIWL